MAKTMLLSLFGSENSFIWVCAKINSLLITYLTENKLRVLSYHPNSKSKQNSFLYSSLKWDNMKELWRTVWMPINTASIKG